MKFQKEELCAYIKETIGHFQYMMFLAQIIVFTYHKSLINNNFGLDNKDYIVGGAFYLSLSVEQNSNR